MITWSIMRNLVLTALIFQPILSWGQLYEVTSSESEGPGTLRAMIEEANEVNTGGVITFNLDIGEQRVIVLKSPLPAITTSGLIIDGRLDDGKVITLDGRNRLLRPVFVYDAEGSEHKNFDFINFIDPTMFESIQEGVQVKVFPNPTSESMVSVEINNIKEYRAPILIELLDLSGNSLASKYIENSSKTVLTNLDLGEDIDPGTYLVSLRINERSYKEKLIIQ